MTPVQRTAAPTGSPVTISCPAGCSAPRRGLPRGRRLAGGRLLGGRPPGGRRGRGLGAGLGGAAGEDLGEELAGVRRRVGRDLLGRALRDQGAAADAAVRAE